MPKLPSPLLSPALKAINLARVLHFLTQLRGLELYSQYFSTHPLGKIPVSKDTEKALLDEVWRLISLDAERAARGDFPPSLVLPEDPLSYFKQAPVTFWDALSVHSRRVENKWRDFSEEVKKKEKDIPDYFYRNFHFQSDGYLSERSAKAYDHQVEILFTGLSGAMRRVSLPFLINFFKKDTNSPLKILDLGCGTGTLTRIIAHSFPDAQIVAVDLSEPYLAYARTRLAPKKLPTKQPIDFQQMDARKLEFEDGTFDLVVSSYLFHEIPEKDRKIVFTEARRVLKSHGIFSVVDSLQVNDVPDFNIFLEQFPKDYHEPFYKNYTEVPLETLGSSHNFEIRYKELALFTKACVFQKI